MPTADARVALVKRLREMSADYFGTMQTRSAAFASAADQIERDGRELAEARECLTAWKAVANLWPLSGPALDDRHELSTRTRRVLAGEGKDGNE